MQRISPAWITAIAGLAAYVAPTVLSARAPALAVASPAPAVPSPLAARPWTRCFDALSIRRLALTGDHVIVVGGSQAGAAGPGAFASGTFIARLGAGGAPQWRFDVTGAVDIDAVLATDDGMTYFVGAVYGGEGRPASFVTGVVGDSDGVLGALGPDGKLRWVKHLGKAGASTAFTAIRAGAIRAGAAGELEVTATFPPGVDLGTGPLGAGVGRDVWQMRATVRFTTAGAVVAATARPADPHEPIVVGEHALRAWEDGAEPTVVHVAYGAGPSPAWTHTFDDSGGFGGLGAARLDEKGNAFIAGGFLFGLDLGGGHALAASPRGAAFIASYQPDGAIRWATALAQPNAKIGDYAWIDELAPDGHGGWLAAGPLKGELTGGTHHVVGAPAGGDANDEKVAGFVADIAADGTVAWIQPFPARVSDLTRGAHTVLAYGHGNGLDPTCIAFDPTLP